MMIGLSIIESLARFSTARIGPKTWIFKIFGDPSESLKKSWLYITPDEYSSVMFLFSILFSAVIADLFAVLFLLKKVQWFFVPLSFVVVFFSTNLGFRLYPSYLASEIGNSLNLRLPYLVIEMAALSDTGMPVEKIFESMLDLEPDRNTKKVLSFIVRNLKVFGMDITKALDETIKRSPSKDFAEFLLSLRGSLLSGSEVRHFLGEYSKKVMIDKKINLRYMIERLNIIAEAFTTLFVVLPSILIIMIFLFSMIGYKPIYTNYLILIIYAIIPLMGVMFILLLEVLRPK